VVLGGQDDAFHAGLFGHAGPLAAIQGGRVERVGRFLTVSPLLVSKGVHVEVNEGIILQFLPVELLGRRQGPYRSRRFYLLRLHRRKQR
jgi:hypothetical protein